VVNGRPPEILENLISRLIPAPCRENIAGDLREQYQSAGQYFILSLRTVPIVIAGRVRQNLDPIVLLIQACGLLVAFEAGWRLSGMPLLTGISQLVRLLMPVLAGLIGLLLRDAYVNPEVRNPWHSAVDPAFGTVFAIVLAAFVGVLWPGEALTAQVLGKGALIALFILFFVRESVWAVMRPGRGETSVTEAANRFQRRSRYGNLLGYVVFAVVVIILGTMAVRVTNPSVRGAPFLIIVTGGYVMYRTLKKSSVDTIPADGSLEASRRLYREHLIRQRDLLLGAWKSLAMMCVPIVLLLFLTPTTLAARFEIRMLALTTYCFGFLLISKLNRVGARKLTQRIQTLDNLEPHS